MLVGSSGMDVWRHSHYDLCFDHYLVQSAGVFPCKELHPSKSGIPRKIGQYVRVATTRTKQRTTQKNQGCGGAGLLLLFWILPEFCAFLYSTYRGVFRIRIRKRGRPLSSLVPGQTALPPPRMFQCLYLCSTGFSPCTKGISFRI